MITTDAIKVQEPAQENVQSESSYKVQPGSLPRRSLFCPEKRFSTMLTRQTTSQTSLVQHGFLTSKQKSLNLTSDKLFATVFDSGVQQEAKRGSQYDSPQIKTKGFVTSN